MSKHILPPTEAERNAAFVTADKLRRQYFQHFGKINKVRRHEKQGLSNSVIYVDIDGSEKKFLLLSKIASGAFAKVVHAIDEKGDLFAVRVQYSTHATDISEERSIGQEVGLIKGLITRTSTSKKPLGGNSHRRGPGVKEYQIQNIGTCLYNFLLQQAMTILNRDRFIIALSLIQKIQELHNKDIAHLDIKPGNLLINPKTYEITVIDYGMSERGVRELSDAHIF